MARSLPGLAEVGGPALVAAMGDPGRFRRGRQFRSFTGLAPKASETGDTDRKGQSMSKAGSSLLRTNNPGARRRHRPQDRSSVARIYYVQMVERGKDHLGALCVVAANLAERAWAVMDRRMPYVVCDTDDRPVSAEEAKAIIAEHWTVPAGAARGWEGPQERPCGTIKARRSRRRRTGRPSPAGIIGGRPRPCHPYEHQFSPTSLLTTDPP